MTYSDYSHDIAKRAAVVSRNRSRRLRGLPALPVPPKPSRPVCRVAYSADGTYEGRLSDDQQAPAGCIVKREPMLW